LFNGGKSEHFNLGNGDGFSVQDVINTVEKVTGNKVNINYGIRREGDPARLVADAEKARSQLGWKPVYSELEIIIKHAWNWECQSLAGG
jgi:UDP-glucose 4-epimerase